MAQHDLPKLASQGRAFDGSRPWTEDELTALILLEKTYELDRKTAAEWVRNGIVSVEQYEKALEVGFSPKSLETVKAEAVAAHIKDVEATVGASTEAETEEVSETEEVAETEAEDEAEAEESAEAEDEAEEVSETDEVAETEGEADVEDVPKAPGKDKNKGKNK